jgi:hypothetical protein
MKRKNSIWIYSLIIMGFAFILTSSCKKKDDNSSNNTNTTTSQTPTLTTNPVTSIGANAALSGGTITSQGADSIIGKGLCWSTSPNPLYNSPTGAYNGSGSANFTNTITGLTHNTTYYVKAYAINSYGVGYGNQVTFTTISQPTGSLSATVNGVAFVATSPYFSTIGGQNGISGSNGSQTINIWLPSTITTGSFSLTLMGNYMAQYFPNATDTYSSTSGTLNISTYNSVTGEIKGTFNFIGTFNSATVNVTNGQFDVY